MAAQSPRGLVSASCAGRASPLLWRSDTDRLGSTTRMISDPISRRRFLRGLGLAGGGIAAGSLLAACQQSSGGGAAPSGPPPSGPPPTQPPAAAAASAPAAAKPTTAAQAAPAAASGASSLKVGATISLTGRHAALGEQVKNGY